MAKSDRRIDIEEISGVTVARLLEKKILDEANKIDHELKNKDEIELDDKGGELVEESGIIFM